MVWYIYPSIVIHAVMDRGVVHQEAGQSVCILY
jgi:hypothetical protein